MDKKKDVFSYDLILIPIHHEGKHWCLAIIDNRMARITYYDSLIHDNPTCITTLRQYMDEESMDKRGYAFDFNGWGNCTPKNIPKQTNGFDCGVFICQYAEYASRNAEFTFLEKDMPQYRKLMKLQLTNQSLL